MPDNPPSPPRFPLVPVPGLRRTLRMRQRPGSEAPPGPTQRLPEYMRTRRRARPGCTATRQEQVRGGAAASSPPLPGRRSGRWR